MFAFSLSQQARQSRHSLFCPDAGQEKPSLETPDVLKFKRFAIATGGCPSIIRADKRTVKFSGKEFCVKYSETKEYSRVGNQFPVATG